jgi:hypothetical protein
MIDIITEVEQLDSGYLLPVYKEYEAPPVNIKEMMRYSGLPIKAAGDAARAYANGEDFPEKALVEEALKLIDKELQFKVGFVMGRLKWDEDGFPVLPFKQHSESLKSNLENCGIVILMASTIGAGIDKLIRRYERTNPALGMFMQGLGAERVESLTDTFNKEVHEAAAKMGYKDHARFSPGFGDVPINVQKDFLATLDAGRRMGILLSESYLMSPSKSVTAIIGLEKRDFRSNNF